MDIDDELKSREELEAARQLLEETETLLQFGSWTLDVDSRTLVWTSGMRALLGYDDAEPEQSASLDFFLDHLTPESRPVFRQTLEDAVSAQGVFTLEYALQTRTGVMKTISAHGRVVRAGDASNGSLKLLCIHRDVTALKNFEKEQERNIRELNRSNRDLEEFAYIASHDLQEPVRKISMFTERLRTKAQGALTSETEMFIDRILASADNMRTLIENLLDFSRVNRRPSSIEPTDLGAVMEAAIAEQELKIEEAQAKIDITGTLPVV